MTSTAISAADPYTRKRIPVLDSEIAYVAARLADHVFGHRRAIRRYDLLEGPLRHDALDTVLDDLGDALAGEVFPTARRLEVAGCVVDLPLDVEVNDQATVVIGEERFPRVGQ